MQWVPPVCLHHHPDRNFDTDQVREHLWTKAFLIRGLCIQQQWRLETLMLLISSVKLVLKLVLTTNILGTDFRQFGNDGRYKPVAWPFAVPYVRTGSSSTTGWGGGTSWAKISKLWDPESLAVFWIPGYRKEALLCFLFAGQTVLLFLLGASHWWKEINNTFWNWSNCMVICLCW